LVAAQVAGFTDAEGSFSIIIDKNNKRNLGWCDRPLVLIFIV